MRVCLRVRVCARVFVFVSNFVRIRAFPVFIMPILAINLRQDETLKVLKRASSNRWNDSTFIIQQFMLLFELIKS